MNEIRLTEFATGGGCARKLAAADLVQVLHGIAPFDHLVDRRSARWTMRHIIPGRDRRSSPSTTSRRSSTTQRYSDRRGQRDGDVMP
jgi:hypothetical protein